MRSKYKLGDLITQRREKNNEIGLPISGVSKDGLTPKSGRRWYEISQEKVMELLDEQGYEIRS